jgi:spermidine synthase
MLKQIISYFIPFSRRIKTQYNGLLEVRWINGKKVLDTSNANYSYGSAQRILKLSLEKINLENVKNLLLLGLGGGSVIKTLREHFNYIGNITAVDIDPVIIRIAEEEFGITGNESLKIECDDALDFLNRIKTKFDLMIIDLFIDNKVPDKFLSVIFWEKVSTRINEDGYLIFNTISTIDSNIEPVKNTLTMHGFDLHEYDKLEGSNRILIGKLSPKAGIPE